MEQTTQASGTGRGALPRLSVAMLFFLGGYILVAPYFPSVLLWERVTGAVGGEGPFLRICVGLLFVYFATLSHEKYALKSLTHDILEAFNGMIYGKDYRRHRATVAEQIARLGDEQPAVRRAAHRALTAMTRQDFPAEHAVWAAWWSQAERTFRLPASDDTVQVDAAEAGAMTGDSVPSGAPEPSAVGRGA